MNTPQNSARFHMESETKEDGRYIIYYKFEALENKESVEREEFDGMSKENDPQKPKAGM